MQVQAFVVVVVALGGKRVGDDDRCAGDEAQRFVQFLCDVPVRFGFWIVRIQRQNRARKLVHDIDARRCEDHVFGKVIRQLPVFRQDGRELRQLVCARQRAEQDQISRLFVSEATFCQKPLNEIHQIDTAIKKLARHRAFFAVLHIVTAYVSDSCKSGHHAGSVCVAQAALYVVLLVRCPFDMVCFCDAVCVLFQECPGFFNQSRFHACMPPLSLAPFYVRPPPVSIKTSLENSKYTKRIWYTKKRGYLPRFLNRSYVRI